MKFSEAALCVDILAFGAREMAFSNQLEGVRLPVMIDGVAKVSDHFHRNLSREEP